MADSSTSEWQAIQDIANRCSGSKWEMEDGQLWSLVEPASDDDAWDTVEHETQAVNELTQGIYNECHYHVNPRQVPYDTSIILCI